MRRIISTIIMGGLTAIVTGAVVTGCTSAPHKSDAERTVSRDDTKITKDIRARLKAEPTYKFDSVDVNTSAGVVQLRGVVNDPDQRKRAEEIARNTAGVADVMNGLVLKPGAAPTPTGYPAGQRFSDPPGNQNAAPIQPNY